MKGSTAVRRVEALVCEPCANRVAELAFLEVPALDERLDVAVLSALESDKPDVSA